MRLGRDDSSLTSNAHAATEFTASRIRRRSKTGSDKDFKFCLFATSGRDIRDYSAFPLSSAGKLWHFRNCRRNSEVRSEQIVGDTSPTRLNHTATGVSTDGTGGKTWTIDQPALLRLERGDPLGVRGHFCFQPRLVLQDTGARSERANSDLPLFAFREQTLQDVAQN
jgi:hypothetical protein